MDGIDSPESVGNMFFTPSRKCSTIEGDEKTRNEINNYLINYAGMKNMMSSEKSNDDVKNNRKMISDKKEEHKKHHKIEHKIEKSKSDSDEEYEMIYDT